LNTPPPPAAWRSHDFDDSGWLRERGADVVGATSRYPAGAARGVYARGTDAFVPEVGLIASRAKFIVRDPSRVAGLELSLTCRGGFVAYLNGTEIARGEMPPGPIEPDTASTHVYPPEAFLARGADGTLGRALHHYAHRHERFGSQWALREKAFGPIAVKSDLLRRGVNVLAIELHRSDYPALCARRKVGVGFATVGLCRLTLGARTPPGNLVTSAGRPEGFRVWNVPSWASVSDTDYGDPCERLRPLRLAGARNGVFGGQFAVGSTTVIEGLTVEPGPLRGPGRIPPDSVRARLGAVNPLHPGRYFSRVNGVGGTRFDVLLDAPAGGADRIEPVRPGVFEVSSFVRPCVAIYRKELGLSGEPVLGATRPVWVEVRVPSDAPAGDYAGTLTVRARGVEPVIVPLELTVADWTLPNVADYASLIFIYQSPDSLAEYYKVPRWSAAHWGLIERSFRLAGRTGNVGLVLPLLAQTQPGNVESLVHWIARPHGGYALDFSRLDRYLDVALAHHAASRLKVVQLYVWGRELGCPRDKRTAKGPDYREKAYRGALVTLLDTRTGRPEELRLPDYERPAAEKLLRPLLTAVRDRLKRRGLAGAMMLGIGSDPGVLPEHVATLHRILPGVPWFRDSHFGVARVGRDRADPRKAVPVACNTVVWSGPIPDPSEQRRYGWRHEPGRYTLSFNRAGVSSLNMHGFPPPWRYRVWMECTFALGRNGVGRVGGDYFVARGGQRVDNRYRGAQIGGALKIYNGCPDLFGPGADGPAGTVRLANTRMGLQEAEARVAIEKALLAGSVPADLARRCRSLLDRRTNAIRTVPLGRSLGRQGWDASTRELFALAAEVARAARK